MKLDIEEERRFLDHLELKAQGMLVPNYETQRKLVAALEQLEQAREALQETHKQYAALTDYIRKRQGAHLGRKQGDVYHEMQAAASGFGLKAIQTGKVMKALHMQALKQQEVGDE